VVASLRNTRRAAVAGAVLVAVAAAVPLAGCANGKVREGEAARGRDLFGSPGALALGLRGYSCETCHDAEAGARADAGPTSGSFKAGAPLAGVTLRSSFWGGQEDDLLQAVNDCRSVFMGSSTPLTASDDDAAPLYAFLASLEPGDSSPAPFTVVRDIQNVPRGDAAAGVDAYAGACAPCHGTAHTGAGSLGNGIPILPEDPLAKHATFSARSQRLVFIEKVRHGAFLGYPGDMPPFSTEVLNDADLSNVLEMLGVLGDL
jgi:thiosulfate dehydrogenase